MPGRSPEALAVAHQAGMVHRDLKPANIMLVAAARGRPQVKLLDFGLAKPQAPLAYAASAETTIGSGPPVTTPGFMVGTVGYMAPEQVRGLPCDHRADIFAFGCMLYEMLSGQRAFKGATPADTISAILTGEPPPLSDLREAVSPGLEQIVSRCLEKRPEDRFSSAHDLGLAMEASATGPVMARPDTAAPGAGATAPVTSAAPRPASALARLTSSVRAHRWLWLLGCLAVLLAVAMAYPAVARQRRVAWVRSQAVPELVRLVDAREHWPAFLPDPDGHTAASTVMLRRPVFDALGTPPDRKHRAVFDGDHTLAGFEKDFMKVNLKWFDRHLGKVR